MKTIEMYQDPKTGMYESLIELAKRKDVKIVYAEYPSTVEVFEIAQIVDCVSHFKMPSIESILNLGRQGYSQKSKYTPQRNTGRPTRGNPMPREIKHIARNYHGRRAIRFCNEFSNYKNQQMQIAREKR